MTKAPRKERAGGWVVLAMLVGLALLLGGGYAAAYYAAGDKTPRGTTVAGVEIGDRYLDDAATALEKGLAGRVTDPIQVTIDGRTVPVDPSEAGLSVDYEASVAEAGAGRSWHPRKIWHYFTGGTDFEPVVEVDRDEAATLIRRLDKRFGPEPVNGRVTFRGGKVNIRDAEPGASLDGDGLIQRLQEDWLDPDAGPIPADLVRVVPAIDQSDVRDAVQEFANPAVSGAVTLRFGDAAVELEPREYAGVIALKPENGELRPKIRGKRLLGLVEAGVSAGAPVDATVRLAGGVPEVVPGRPGVDFKPKDVVAAFRKAITTTKGDRSAEVPSTVVKPEFTTADAEALGIKEQVSSFTTYYPHSDYRNVNLGRAAELIDGTVLKPGETFSMNGTVGERTAANGFTEGYIIADGILKKDYGGGVSQMATTMFNAMYFAGLKDIEHKPHSFYIDRYPVGREATLAWPVLDLRFQNDTDYGVLIDAHVTPSTSSSPGEVTVTMYSTKIYDVESFDSERYNYREPETREIWDDPNCEEHTGWSGFDIDVTRVIKDADTGAEIKRETFHTAYTPSDHVECHTTPADPEPSPSEGDTGQNADANDRAGGDGS